MDTIPELVLENSKKRLEICRRDFKNIKNKIKDICSAEIPAALNYKFDEVINLIKELSFVVAKGSRLEEKIYGIEREIELLEVVCEYKIEDD